MVLRIIILQWTLYDEVTVLFSIKIYHKNMTIVTAKLTVKLTAD